MVDGKESQALLRHLGLGQLKQSMVSNKIIEKITNIELRVSKKLKDLFFSKICQALSLRKSHMHLKNDFPKINF